MEAPGPNADWLTRQMWIAHLATAEGGEFQYTDLHRVCDNDDLAGLQRLMREGDVPVYQQDDKGRTPCVVAQQKGHYRIMSELYKYVALREISICVLIPDLVHLVLSYGIQYPFVGYLMAEQKSCRSTKRINCLFQRRNGALVSGSMDGVIRVSDPEGKEAGRQVAENDSPSSFAELHDKRMVCSGLGGVIKVWDSCFSDPPLRYMFTPNSVPVKCMAVLEGSLILTGHLGDSIIRVWDCDSGQVVGELRGQHTGSVNTLLVLPDEGLASGSNDESVVLWARQPDCQSRVVFHASRVLDGHSGFVLSLARVSIGLASGSEDATVRVWSLANGVCLRVFRHTSSVVSMVLLGDLKLCTGSDDGQVSVWTVESGVLAKRINMRMSDFQRSLFNQANVVDTVKQLMLMHDGHLVVAQAGKIQHWA